MKDLRQGLQARLPTARGIDRAAAVRHPGGAAQILADMNASRLPVTWEVRGSDARHRPSPTRTGPSLLMRLVDLWQASQSGMVLHEAVKGEVMP